MTIHDVLNVIAALLVTPNPNSPLEGAIADEYKTNRASYNKNAKEWTRQYANGQLL